MQFPAKNSFSPPSPSSAICTMGSFCTCVNPFLRIYSMSNLSSVTFSRREAGTSVKLTIPSTSAYRRESCSRVINVFFTFSILKLRQGRYSMVISQYV